ncbi:MAG: nuclear transport factor 2 family protein [Candidatus Sulfotelmatobacter sp.]
MNIFLGLISLTMMLVSGSGVSAKSASMNKAEMSNAITLLRSAYAAFNQGDIDAAVSAFDPNIDWVEPSEFPGGGAYEGREGAKQYLTQSRARCEQVISEPVKFIPAGARIVVFVHARVLPKGSNQWQEIDLADVYTFSGGKPVSMHAFARREDALKWAGVKQ